MVDSLWMPCEVRFFCTTSWNKTRLLHSVDAPSMLLSLEQHGRPARIPPRFQTSTTLALATGTHVHRFDEVINGREYRIEVSSVGLGQWRAQIARRPGGSAALMPFYGKTPDEAAQQLSRWLALAHGQSHQRT